MVLAKSQFEIATNGTKILARVVIHVERLRVIRLPAEPVAPTATILRASETIPSGTSDNIRLARQYKMIEEYIWSIIVRLYGDHHHY